MTARAEAASSETTAVLIDAVARIQIIYRYVPEVTAAAVRVIRLIAAAVPLPARRRPDLAAVGRRIVENDEKAPGVIYKYIYYAFFI